MGKQIDAFVAGYMAARDVYGTTDSDDNGGAVHGAECERVRGPYMCTCNPDGERTEAYLAAKWWKDQK